MASSCPPMRPRNGVGRLLICGRKKKRLNMDSGELREQQLQDRAEQGFSSSSDVMNELKKAQVQRQIRLRDTAMRTQPRSQKRPKPFHGVDMDFTKAVTIVITGVFSRTVTHAFVIVAPFFQATVDVILICIDKATQSNRGL